MEGRQLAGFRDAVVVRVRPELQLLEDGVGRVDDPIAIPAKLGRFHHLQRQEALPFGRSGLGREVSEEAVVRPYGDLKRHDMGPGLAETIDEAGTGASVWITKELWGVATSAPYLHDGRATTLTEAILEHGGEANASRQLFEALPLGDQQDLISFLDSLALFKLTEE